MKKLAITLLCIISAAGYGCSKYLDEKPNQSLSSPSTLQDLQAILDIGSNNWSVSAVNFLTDEFYMPYDYWLGATDLYKNSYVWQPVNDDLLRDWTALYRTVEYANIVLDNADKVRDDTTLYKRDRNTIKGAALFYRAFSFWGLAQLFAASYDSTQGGTKVGIPLRLSSDFNVATAQSTVAETYAQIVSDLKEAVDLLPLGVEYQTRPSGYAAMAMLARVYLNMGQYAEAYAYANRALSSDSGLLDYNALNETSAFPLELFNTETVFYASPSINISTNANISFIDTLLYNSYDTMDLRRKFFFRDGTNGVKIYRGGYTGRATLFNGLSKDELYLVKAECALRLDDESTALNTLNGLLMKRYTTGTFKPYKTVSKDSLMQIILSERKKELVFRGTRWSDIRRLNYHDNKNITVKRRLSSQEYILDPDTDIVFSIPQTVKNLTSLP